MYRKCCFHLDLKQIYVLQTKDNPEKRLSLKEHIYEIARQRNYSEEKISSLITFSFLRVLIIVDKDCDFKYLATCPFALEVDAGWEKVGKRLAELVL